MAISRGMFFGVIVPLGAVAVGAIGIAAYAETARRECQRAVTAATTEESIAGRVASAIRDGSTAWLDKDKTVPATVVDVFVVRRPVKDEYGRDFAFVGVVTYRRGVKDAVGYMPVVANWEGGTVTWIGREPLR